MNSDILRLKMNFPALILLLVVSLTKQELLSVTSSVSTDCGKPVSLHCNASSHRPGLTIARLAWSHGHAPLCSVNGHGEMVTHHKHTAGFHCQYADGQLVLVLQKVVPMETTEPYRCKLHSNQGIAHGHTHLRLHECCVSVEGVLTADGPVCNFTCSRPGAEVYWFHGSQNLSGGSVSESVDSDGWLRIHSSLVLHPSRKWERFNCSLKSGTSGRYISSAAIQRKTSRTAVNSGSSTAGGQSFLIVLLVSLVRLV